MNAKGIGHFGDNLQLLVKLSRFSYPLIIQADSWLWCISKAVQNNPHLWRSLQDYPLTVLHACSPAPKYSDYACQLGLVLLENGSDLLVRRTPTPRR